MIGIYKITSPTGKIYIGQSINIENRKKDYNQNGCLKNQPKIYRSILKYGWDNHKHDIIEECSLEDLDEKEIYWKQYYIDLIGWGKLLFCGLYDRGGGPKSLEWKQNISNNHPSKKPVVQLDLENNILNEFISMNDAFKQTGVRVGDISACCLGKQKTAYNFKWIFKDKNLRPIIIIKPRKQKTWSKEGLNSLRIKHLGNNHKFGKGKPINQYNLEGNFIKTWLGGAAEVNRILGLNPQAINNNLMGIVKTSNGFIWKFKVL